MPVIKERCAEESDSFIESIVSIIYSIHEGKRGIKVSQDIASKKLRDLSKCILRKQEY